MRTYRRFRVGPLVVNVRLKTDALNTYWTADSYGGRHYVAAGLGLGRYRAAMNVRWGDQ